MFRVTEVCNQDEAALPPPPARDILDVPEVSKVRSRDFREVMIGYLLIMLVVWTPNPVQRVLFWIAFAWIAYATAASRPNLASLGLSLSFKFSSLLRSTLLVSGAIALAGAAVVAAIKLHTLHELYGSVPVGRHMWGYIIWAFMQQFILQTYFLARLQRLVPNQTAAIFLAAGMFASAHLPNPVLTVVTFVWGVAACALFLRSREIYSLGTVHAILGLCVAFTVPSAIHHHMRVGLGYIRYHHDYPTQPPEVPDHSVEIRKS